MPGRAAGSEKTCDAVSLILVTPAHYCAPSIRSALDA